MIIFRDVSIAIPEQQKNGDDVDNENNAKIVMIDFYIRPGT